MTEFKTTTRKFKNYLKTTKNYKNNCRKKSTNRNKQSFSKSTAPQKKTSLNINTYNNKTVYYSKEFMNNQEKIKIYKALKKASALHKKQSKVIEKHVKEMKSYGKKKRA